MWDKYITGVVILWFTAWGLVPTLADTDPNAMLGCHKRNYTFKATKTNFDGRKCWDYVRVKSCWGRCDSLEIPDWRFPFKLIFHPVCMHEQTEIRKILLRNCDEDVPNELRIYEYVEAITCTCRLCNSSTASCEAPHHKKHSTKTQIPLDIPYLPNYLSESLLTSD